MRTLMWLLFAAAVGVVCWKEGRGSVGDEMLAVVHARQNVSIQRMLLDSELRRCVKQP